jgi:hypothetical protein
MAEEVEAVELVPGQPIAEPVYRLIGEVLDAVADERELEGIDGELWSTAVRHKFDDIDVLDIRDFMRSVLQIQNMLHAAGHRRLHAETLELMLEDACNSLFGPRYPADPDDPDILPDDLGV